MKIGEKKVAENINWSNWYAKEVNGVVVLRDEIFEMPKYARRVFHDGQNQGWEIDNCLFVFLCFLEKERVGKLLFYIQKDDAGKKIVEELLAWMNGERNECM